MTWPSQSVIRLTSALRPTVRDWQLLALYAVGFGLTHWIAVFWGGQGFYSLWFPAAGLRLALLWRVGAQLTPWVALIELAVDAVTGIIRPGMPGLGTAIIGVVRPVFAYGLVVAGLHWIAQRPRASAFVSPVPFGLATVFGPVAAALAALPQAVLRPELTGVSGTGEIASSLLAFAIGDLLGVLSIGPPVMWIADLLSGRGKMRMKGVPAAAVLESGAVMMIAVLSAIFLQRLNLNVWTAPALLAVLWIGMRFGQAAAWIATTIAIGLALFYSAGDLSMAHRLELHLHLAILAVAGYLAGSLAEAQALARRNVQRRDRLLFQAERLKTLRAMSVAVIHEISQPLSTLAIEARHLHGITRDADPEIAASSELIDRKTATLADLVRRLRRFGGRAVDEPSALPLSVLIDSVMALVGAEAKAAGVSLSVGSVDPDIVVLAQEVELAQAVVNLLRNAVQACAGAGAQVDLTVTHDTAMAQIVVANRCDAHLRERDGMGIGTIVARAIVEAHGGTLTRDLLPPDRVRATITLPRHGDIG